MKRAKPAVGTRWPVAGARGYELRTRLVAREPMVVTLRGHIRGADGVAVRSESWSAAALPTDTTDAPGGEVLTSSHFWIAPSRGGECELETPCGVELVEATLYPLAINWRRDGTTVLRRLAANGRLQAWLAFRRLGREAWRDAGTRATLLELARGDVRRARELTRACRMPPAWRRALAPGRRLPRSLVFAGDRRWFYRLQRWFDVAVVDAGVPGWRARLATADSVVLAGDRRDPELLDADVIVAAARERGLEVLWLTAGDAAAAHLPRGVRRLWVGGRDGLPPIP